MTKVRGPMFSVTASGTVGDAIEFVAWKGSVFRKEEERSGVAYVRRRGMPLIPKTAAVLAIRATLAAGVSTWQDNEVVPSMDRLSWASLASGTGMSGFNRYCAEFIELNPQREPTWNIPSPGGEGGEEMVVKSGQETGGTVVFGTVFGSMPNVMASAILDEAGTTIYDVRVLTKSTNGFTYRVARHTGANTWSDVTATVPVEWIATDAGNA